MAALRPRPHASSPSPSSPPPQVDVNIKALEPFWATSTRGSIGVHINSDEHAGDQGGSRESDKAAWIDFDAGW